MSFQHGDLVMFPLDSIIVKGYFVGSFVDVKGTQRSVVQVTDEQYYAANHLIVEKWNANSRLLIGKVLREERILPPVKSSKY